MTVDLETGRVSMTEDEYASFSQNSTGVCIKCGEDASEIEPDAHEYKCQSCGSRSVYGIEELVIMDMVDFE
jgi:hypothetical protein